MKYKSTRDETQREYSFEEALFSGYCSSDGGLFVPASLPSITAEHHLIPWSKLAFPELAYAVIVSIICNDYFIYGYTRYLLIYLFELDPNNSACSYHEKKSTIRICNSSAINLSLLMNLMMTRLFRWRSWDQHSLLSYFMALHSASRIWGEWIVKLSTVSYQSTNHSLLYWMCLRLVLVQHAASDISSLPFCYPAQ